MDLFWTAVKDKLMNLSLLEKFIVLVVILLLASFILTSLKTFLYLAAGAAIVIGGWYLYNKYTKKNV